MFEKSKQYSVQIALAAIIVLQLVGEVRRTYISADIKRAATNNRTMLNSRAQIQIILINATLEGRRLDAAEIDRIKQLWSKAEYDQTAEMPSGEK